MQRLTPQEFYTQKQYRELDKHGKRMDAFTYYDMLDFAEAYADHCEASEWISVNERLPDDNTSVLGEDSDGEVFRCYLNKNGKWHEDVVHYDCSCDWNHGGSDSEIYKPVVRWRPLPTPPKQ